MTSWRTEFNGLFSGKRVLVTGATGFIGSHLVETLTALKADVFGLGRSPRSQFLIPGVIYRFIDLTDLEATQETIHEIHPQIVYHLAAYVTANQDISLTLPMLRNNLITAVHLLLSLAKNGCERLIIAGTSDEPVDGVPSSPYSAAKAAVSLYSQMFHHVYKIPVVMTTLFMAYGPRQQTSKLIPYTIRSLLNNDAPRLINGDRICDLVYIQDIVRGLLLSGIQPGLEGKTVELGTGQGKSIKEIVHLIARLSESLVEPYFEVESTRVQQAPRVANLRDTRELLGWEPRWTINEALRETILWFKQELEAHSDSGRSIA